MSLYYTTLHCAQGHYSVRTDPALRRPLTDSGCMYASHFISTVTPEVKVERRSDLRAERSLSMGVERSLSMGVEQSLSMGVERSLSMGVERSLSMGAERSMSMGAERSSNSKQSGVEF